MVPFGDDDDDDEEIEIRVPVAKPVAKPAPTPASAAVPLPKAPAIVAVPKEELADELKKATARVAEKTEAVANKRAEGNKVVNTEPMFELITKGPKDKIYYAAAVRDKFGYSQDDAILSVFFVVVPDTDPKGSGMSHMSIKRQKTTKPTKLGRVAAVLTSSMPTVPHVAIIVEVKEGFVGNKIGLDPNKATDQLARMAAWFAQNLKWDITKTGRIQFLEIDFTDEGIPKDYSNAVLDNKKKINKSFAANGRDSLMTPSNANTALGFLRQFLTNEVKSNEQVQKLVRYAYAGEVAPADKINSAISDNYLDDSDDRNEDSVRVSGTVSESDESDWGLEEDHMPRSRADVRDTDPTIASSIMYTMARPAAAADAVRPAPAQVHQSPAPSKYNPDELDDNWN